MTAIDATRATPLALLATAVAVLAAAGAACRDSDPDGPRPRRVEPASGPAGQATLVRILGQGFTPLIRADFDDPARSSVAASFEARLSDRALSAVSFVSASELTATVPADLSPGTHDLLLIDPRGKQGRLAAAFTVLTGDAGPPRDASTSDRGPDAPTSDTLAPDTLAPDTLAPDTQPTGVHTLAGSGAAGLVDGPALQSAFDSPRGVALAGNAVVVSDFNNHCIRKIEAGQVTTLAGSGTQGYADGPAAAAQLSLPDGIAVDDAGVIYVADSANSCVRRIASGQVTTAAGLNATGLIDGPTAAARFDAPRDVAIGATGRIYVADSNNHRIRLIEGGQVTTFAGSIAGFADGPAATARFDRPSGLHVVGDKIYVADTGNQRIRLIDGGQVTTVAGTGDAGKTDGPAAQASFWNPTDVASVTGDLYVIDQANHSIRRIDAAGAVSSLNGPGFGHADGPLATALFFYPRAAVAGPGGELYVADQSNHRVRVIYF